MSYLPEGWSERELKDCVEILDSKRKPINNRERQQRIEGKDHSVLYPYFGATGKVGYIDDYLFDGNYVALGEDGVPFFDSNKRKAYLLCGKTWVNNHAHVLDGIKVENRYLCYYLNQFDYHGYVNGATRLKLTQANMRRIPLRLAPENDQKRIADKLDSVLAKVEAAQARLDKIPIILKRFRQSVLAAATSGELTKEWREEDREAFKKVKLGNAGVIVKTGPFGSALHKSEYIESGIPVVNPTHINEGKISPSESMTITKEKARELKSWKLSVGDVIVGRRGEMGRAAEIKKEHAQMLCGTGSMIIKTEKSGISSAFLTIALRSPTAIQFFESNSVGSTMINLNQKIIKAFEIYYPTKEEQSEIVYRVDTLFELANKLEKQYNTAKARLDKLTQSILAKAFRGELLS